MDQSYDITFDVKTRLKKEGTRGDPVAILDKQKAALASGFLHFSCNYNILFGCGDRI
ncbi:hypothetical protein [Bradyrhizobium sp. 2S1]|uniref:hypothetical protein n=1 Tax=Bradyrhizobium sp. 2S1 TaxID=1404429 RepID=UPI0014074E0C|nr:hypothetical protein [Bradyrhizobium sp. 2S1]MCK7666125.1 hypothetical protein [Bradyrhizobium sp. 2S1]